MRDIYATSMSAQVRVVASMPCYSKDNVDQQRGGGVFRRSIAGLRKLNEVGYGRPGTGLVLDLVYNPNGDFLAPPQHTLEPAYRAELRDAFGIEFSTLLCLNNMPIKRFWDYLEKRGKLESYMQLLVDNFNPAAGESVMCRDTVSVAWDGRMCAPARGCSSCCHCAHALSSGFPFHGLVRPARRARLSLTCAIIHSELKLAWLQIRL